MFEKTSSNRREFLSQCTKLALAGGLLPSSALARSAALWEVSLDSIGFGQFLAQVGTAFRVRKNGGSAVSLVLLDATRTETSPSRTVPAQEAGNERFSLVFMGPTTVSLDQDTYAFEHPRLGRFGMFIVPLHSRSGEYGWYEAIFNRRPVMLGRRDF